ncbi:hypothetical protein M153_7968000208, partial [Pseudoloma neurophilia]
MKVSLQKNMQFGQIFQIEKDILDENIIRLQVYGHLKPKHLPVPTEKHLFKTINRLIEQNIKKSIQKDEI